MVLTQQYANQTRATYWSFCLKTYFQRNFKSEAPQLQCKTNEQMREIARFAFFSHGSSQLGSLIYYSLSPELHRKATLNHNANHKSSRKQCFNIKALYNFLCLVQLAGFLAGWLPGWLTPCRPSPTKHIPQTMVRIFNCLFCYLVRAKRAIIQLQP